MVIFLIFPQLIHVDLVYSIYSTIRTVHSRFRKQEWSQKWMISDASTVLQKARQTVDSPPFSILGLSTQYINSVSWSQYISKYLRKVNIESTTRSFSSKKTDDNALTISLKHIEVQPQRDVAYGASSSGPNVWLKEITFAIYDTESKEVTGTTRDTMLIKDGQPNTVETKLIIPENTLDRYLSDGALTIHAKGIYFLTSSPISSVCQENIHKADPLKSFKQMFEEALFSDVVIKTGETVFKVHRGLLASHSSVFKRMFEVEMVEKREQIVEVTDIEPHVMSDFLTFLYTGSAPNVRVLAKDLLLAADKYDMPEFATICESEIKNGMTFANVAEIYQLASTLHLGCSASLKKFCLDFMKQNTAAVYKSDAWKKLKEASMELAMGVVESVAAQ